MFLKNQYPTHVCVDHIPVTPVNFMQSFRMVYKTLYSARKVLISKLVKQHFIAFSWIKSF